MRGCDYIAKYFADKGLKHCFGFQGGAITPLIDALALKEIEFVQSYHEQASGFAAEAYARVNQDIALAVATNGPGATNFVSAIANAYLDSTPCIFITGQVNTTDIKTANVRQNGFQEVDTVEMVKPITKYAQTVLSVNDIKYELDKALDIASSGRKGCVLLDFPLNILMSEVDEKQFKIYIPQKYDINISEQQITQAVELLQGAKRPLVLIGGGVRLSDSQDELKKFLQKSEIPSVSSLMGQDVFAPTHYGFSGLYGQTYANLAILNADVILILGSRLSKRQFGKELDAYAPHAKLIQVDIDENELPHVISPFISIHANLKNFLIQFNQQISKIDCEQWKAQLKKWHIQYQQHVYVNGSFDPVKYVEEIAQNTPSDAIITTDVGQNQMWVAQGWQLKNGQRILTSGGLGCMGFSLPAAIGAQIAAPNKNVIAFMGDGGLQMNIQELQAIAQHRLPIKIVVFNNQSLGMIQEMQHKYMGNRYVGTKQGYSCPDLQKIASAYGICYIKYDSNWHDIMSCTGPVLVEIALDKNNPTRVLIRYDKNAVYQQERLNG